jgi:hypothetical protein
MCHRHLYKVEISSLLVPVGLNESGHPELTLERSEKVCPVRDSPFVFVVVHVPPQKGIMLWLDCSNVKSFFLVKTICMFCYLIIRKFQTFLAGKSYEEC